MWRSVQASIQGRSHIEQNIPCQDKTFVYNNNDTCVLSLSDGAGSAKYSHFSAEGLTKKIACFLGENYETLYASNLDEFKTSLFSSIDLCLVNLRNTYDCENQDLAATLLCIAIKNNSFICIHIGDGVIGCLNQDNLEVLSLPNNGEFINTTSFVTSKNRYDEIKIFKKDLGTIEGFFLMSDGSAEGLFHKKTKKFSPALHKLITYCNLVPLEILELEINKSLKNTLTKVTQDDCSLVISAKTMSTYSFYKKMTQDDKKKFLEIQHTKQCKKIFNRFNQILNLSKEYITIQTLSKKVHIKQKYIKKYLKKMLALKLITRKHSSIKIFMED